MKRFKATYIPFILSLALFSLPSQAMKITIHTQWIFLSPLADSSEKPLLMFMIAGNTYQGFLNLDMLAKRQRKGPVTFNFHGEHPEISLPVELSDRLIELLTGNPAAILNYRPSPRQKSPATGAAAPSPTIPCMNIFNYIVFGLVDTSGSGFVITESTEIDLLEALRKQQLKVGNIVVFRNPVSLMVGNAMLYIGNGILMGWNTGGRHFFFQTAKQALEHYAKFKLTQIEISRKVVPYSEIPVEGSRDWEEFMHRLFETSPSAGKLFQKHLIKPYSYVN